MKKCPFCAEEIQDEAIICRFCNFDLKTRKPIQPQFSNAQKAETKSSVSDGVKLGCGMFIILPLIIIGALIILGIFFGMIGSSVQQRREKEIKRIIEGDDLKRKAKAVAESTELAARNILVNNDLRMAKRLVESFQKRERLQGCVLYGKEGKILAITERISKWQDENKPYIQEALASKQPHAGLEKLEEYSVYSYALPVLDEKDNILGIVEVIYGIGDKER